MGRLNGSLSITMFSAIRIENKESKPFEAPIAIRLTGIMCDKINEEIQDGTIKNNIRKSHP